MKKQDTLGKLIESIAQNLPEGWVIRLSVEKGAAYVDAVRPDGSEVEIYEDEATLYDTLQIATIFAVRESGANVIATDNPNKPLRVINTEKTCGGS